MQTKGNLGMGQQFRISDSSFYEAMIDQTCFFVLEEADWQLQTASRAS